MRYAVLVPWYDPDSLTAWMKAWDVSRPPSWLILQQDAHREGCAMTKNRGVVHAAELGVDVLVILDDDCYPGPDDGYGSLAEFAELHVQALEPQPVRMFHAVTDPPSRGTPYSMQTLTMPVAASMGFWSEIGDYCAVRQLVHDAEEMVFNRKPIHGKYFPLCGMNLAFRPKESWPWCQFVDVPRFDDIWMGWLWQRHAYAHGHCFNLNGPLVRHVRQSNVWNNLGVEVRHLERNETLWRDIALSDRDDYESLIALLPADAGGTDR